MPRPRSLLTNTVALVGGNVGSLLLAFGLSVLIGRGLGEAGLGTYVTVLAWVFPLLMLAEFGTNTLLTRDLATDTTPTHIYLEYTSHLRYWIGGGLLLLMWAGAPLLSDNPSVIAGLRLAAPLLLIEPGYGAYTAIFRAHQAMLPIPMLNVGMLVVQVILTGLVIWRGGDAIAIIGVNTVTSGGRLLVAWWLYRVRYRPVSPRPAKRPAHLIRRAAPFAIAGVLAAAHMRLNYLLLEPLAGAAAVGTYAAGIRLIEAARVLPAAYYDALMPKLTATPTRGDAQRDMRHGTLAMLGYGALVAVGATVAAPWVIRWTYGPAFAPSAGVTILAGWLLGIALVRELWVVQAYAKGHEWWVNRALGFMLVVGIAGGLVLIPMVGILGGVVAWGIAELAGLLVLSGRGLVERWAQLGPPHRINHHHGS